ncbi:MAG TPA: hypothetical protein VG276_27975 [Actinomycetes bacterium]|jgi:hypothetical protein|nr:hypothetical protein [Actinomycetes bacterium]
MSTVAGGLDLDALHLAAGAHGRRADGTSLLEAAAWWAGEAHSDTPACVSPVLATLGRSWAAALNDGPRQRLKPLIPKLATSADDGRDRWRALQLADWLVRSATPALLRCASLAGHATPLERAAPISDWESALAVQPTVEAAGYAARSGLEAAWATSKTASQAVEASTWATHAAGVFSARDGCLLELDRADGLTLTGALVAALRASQRQQADGGALERVCSIGAAMAVRQAVECVSATALTAALRAPSDSAWAVLRPTVRYLQDAMFGLFGQLCEETGDQDE